MSSTEFTARWLEALDQLGDEDAQYTFRIESGHTGKPRASSVGGCGRQQGYATTGVPKTDPGGPPWAAMMGYAGEAIVRRVLTRMGYEMTSVELPKDLVFSGHVDDVIRGLDLDIPHVWDNKVRGTYGMRMLIQQGLPTADPQMYLQMQLYMLALGLSKTMLTIVPHDLSMMRREVKSYKLDVDSPLIYRIIVDADTAAQDVALTRATEVAAANALSVVIRREYDRKGFPCTWNGGGCEWFTRCVVDDDGDQLQLTPIPPSWTSLEPIG